MERNLEGFAVACALWLALAAPVAQAQKSGGVLIMSHFDSPASMSMLEEATGAVNRPMMGVFNNLVIYDQHVPQNSMASIVPDLAIGWSWNEDGTELTMPLRQGVRWHDGKPFTAKDVQCTWDLLASGWSPVYPCHVSPRDMRAHPIGTGPVQIRRIPAERANPRRSQPRVLETGPALSRRHRVADRSELGDAHPGVRRRQFRPGLRRDNPAVARS